MESQLRGLKVNEVVSAENSLKVSTRNCGCYIYEEADEKHVNVGFLGKFAAAVENVGLRMKNEA